VEEVVAEVVDGGPDLLARAFRPEWFEVGE
jgi:hypothetical protein